MISGLAAMFGVNPRDLAAKRAQGLPQVVNHLTPAAVKGINKLKKPPPPPAAAPPPRHEVLLGQILGALETR